MEAVGVMAQRFHEQVVLVAKGLIEAAFVQARAGAQVCHGGSLVTFGPERIHSCLQGSFLVKLARPANGP